MYNWILCQIQTKETDCGSRKKILHSHEREELRRKTGFEIVRIMAATFSEGISPRNVVFFITLPF
jgi:hypothetical protein